MEENTSNPAQGAGTGAGGYTPFSPEMSQVTPPSAASAPAPATPPPATPPPATPVMETPPPPSDPHEHHRISTKLFAVLILLVVGLASSVFFYHTTKDRHVAVKQFTNVYSFVPEKISKSAAIQINVPEGVSEEEARGGISFSPEVEGSWQTEELESVVVYKPIKPLKTGVYYAVNMDTGSVQMSGDFFVDEDPQVEAIFPVAGSESHEDSEITIVFNRPMVPLTTLSKQEEVPLPITITPETPGKFKWISTRNLQFMPETTLVPSSDYTVKIDEGLYSVDGLPVAPVTHTFVTRPLRYQHVSEGQIGYRSPIIIQFNQPVNLDKSGKLISVQTQEGESVSIEVEYGETTRYDRESRKHVTEEDPSKLFVYQKRDKHGRAKLWDFETTYNVSLSGGVPLYGTKDLAEGKNTVVNVPDIVKKVTAESDATSLVRPDLLDPAGSLTVTFYDEVDINKSKINVKGLDRIEYGERCKTDENGNTIRLGSKCEEEKDPEKLIFHFKPEAFGKDESFTLDLQKIETPDGFEMNADPIGIDLKTYPQLSLIHSVPENGSREASAGGGVYMCTNVPLKAPEEGYVDEYLNAEGYVIYGEMGHSRYIYNKSQHYDQCNTGEFETWFQYGLMPETDYTFSVSLKDVFEQTYSSQLALHTKEPESKYVRFHNMQQQYNVTPSDRTKLTYAVENMEYVNMHICRMEPETFLQRVHNKAYDTTGPISEGCTDVVSEKILLPARYWVNNYFQVDLAKYFTDTRGHYIITFGNHLYREQYGQKRLRFDRTYVSVTDLAVGKKEVDYDPPSYGVSTNPDNDAVLDAKIDASRNLYWVNNGKTLTPVVGASVTQYIGESNRTLRQGGSGSSNGEGVARVAIDPELAGAVIRAGADTAVVSDWADTLNHAGETRDASRTYVYTDRPIYRPGHTVHIRGIDRIGFDGSYEVWNEGEAKLTVYDAEGKNVYEVMLPQNEYGTFNTEFELPLDASLGTYNIEVFGQRSRFDVEEYVPAAFKLEAETNQEEYINGDTLKLDVQADYYFGVPLDEGTVSYSVTAQNYHFDRYTDEYFNFGRGWYYCYSCGYGDDFLFRGTAELSENGRATIERELDFSDYFDDLDNEGSKLITVSVTVQDSNGRSVSLQKSFIVHKGEFYIGAKTDRYYTSKDAPVGFRVKTVNTEGEPVALSNIKRTLYKVSWETFKRQEVDGGFYYRSEKKLDEISSERIKTDKNGNWREELTFPEEGQYEVHVEREDGRGTNIRSVSNIYIYGSRSISVPPNNNYELDLEVEKSSLDVGDTASVLIKSPYDKAKVLITAERGTVYDYWIKDVIGGLYLHEFPIQSEYAPNVFVSALLLSDDPEVKYGSTRYEIGTQEHELDVSVTSNKTHYLPGEEVTLYVETKDHTGRATPAEVSLAVADLSVLALKGNPKKNPMMFFYDGFPLSVTTASNIKNVLHEVDIPLGTKGGGGADPDDLAKKKRGVFKDTAFWSASVVTGGDGKASVTFTLPDNLTTWQIEGLGVTSDTKLGVDYNEFSTKKDLMAVPLKPRFVVPGDTFSLGAKVFNQTDRGTDVKVLLESETLEFTGSNEDSIFINGGESKTEYFEVKAPTDMKNGSHVFTFTASDPSFVDSVDQSIAITPNTTYETVATANFTKDDRAVEYLYIPDEVISGDGGLTINANATMAVFMSDALTYMARYPHGCSEQLSSALSTIATLSKALSLPNVEGDPESIEIDGEVHNVADVVERGLERVYQNQSASGGFSYYTRNRPSLYLTLHVVDAMVVVKEAGYEVNEDVLRRAVAYIESETKRQYNDHPESNKETMILAEYILRRANGGTETGLTSEVVTIVNDKAFLNEEISSMTLAYLTILSSQNFNRSLSGEIYDVLKNRIDIDGRGAYLSTVETANYRYFETSIKDTALLLKVFAAREDEHPAMGNVLRWLLASRDDHGVWGGTHNTFVVVDGMIDYLEWQHETESHFVLKGVLDGVEIFGHEFKPSNVFETFTHFIPIDDLAREKLMPLMFDRENKGDRKNNMYYDMALKYFLPVEALPPRDEGITITRGLYRLDDTDEEEEVSEAAVGEVIKGKLTITIPDEYAHVSVEDMIPAGFEIVNFNLATEDQSLKDMAVNTGSSDTTNGLFSRIAGIFGGSQTAQVFKASGFRGGYRNTDQTRTLRPTHIESHDDRVFLYIESLPEGVYEYTYFLRALVPGTFQHMPARAEELFFPEVFGRTGGDIITVTPQE